jgi:hypothetical protein
MKYIDESDFQFLFVTTKCHSTEIFFKALNNIFPEFHLQGTRIIPQQVNMCKRFNTGLKIHYRNDLACKNPPRCHSIDVSVPILIICLRIFVETFLKEIFEDN